METNNALITGTMLGIEDHGIMSFYLYLDYGDSGQGAGGYTLDTPVHDALGKFSHRTGTAAGLSLIMEILRVVGVGKWEDLKGKYIRVEHDHSHVYSIGHITKKEWLNFEQFFKNYEKDK